MTENAQEPQKGLPPPPPPYTAVSRQARPEARATTDMWSIAEPRLTDSFAASRDDLFLSHDSSFYLKTENCFIHHSLLLEE